MDKPLTFSGRVARLFIDSKLTPLVILVSLLMGGFAVATTPREEDPSVTVTVADVLVAYPGRGAQEIDERISRPMAAAILELPDVEHVQSSAGDDGAVFVVLFREGIPKATALTQLREQLETFADKLPPGVPFPTITPRGIEDVPILAVSMWADDSDPILLRRIAAEVAAELESIDGVSRVEVNGGANKEMLVELDAQRLADYGLAADQIVQALAASNVQFPAGDLQGPSGRYRVEVGTLLESASDVESLVVGAQGTSPVYLQDVGTVRHASYTRDSYVSHLEGLREGTPAHPSVTLTVHKVLGTDASALTGKLEAELEDLESTLLRDDIHTAVVVNAGDDANDRVLSLLEHMVIATMVVVLLIALALGRREALIVAVVIPVTLAIVPVAYSTLGFTLNRITLSAMIFAIGILVDDAIVVIENIHRNVSHGGESGVGPKELIIKAVDEVGNPTILATFTVVAALMPTAFVSGMTGQFLQALPIGASVAMVYSLAIALVVTPYLALRLLRHPHPSQEAERSEDAESDASATEDQPTVPHEEVSTPSSPGVYARLLQWLTHRWWRMLIVELCAVAALVGSLGLVLNRTAVIKLLPVGDVNQMSVILEMSQDSTLEETNARATELAHSLAEIPEVRSAQIYAGVPGPTTFQGVARHYMYRTGAHQAEVVIQLIDGSDRDRRSTEIAAEVRDLSEPYINGARGEWMTVAEPPMGPPIQAGLVGFVYGESPEVRKALAETLHAQFVDAPEVRDVFWSGEAGPPVLRYELDLQKAAVQGVVPATAARTLRTLVAGDTSVELRSPYEREPVPLRVQLERGQRSEPEDLLDVYFSTVDGRVLSAEEIGSVVRREGSTPIQRWDLVPIVMVTAEVADPGPIYAALDLTEQLRSGEPRVDVLWTGDPPETDAPTVRWGGEWTVTYDLFTELGLAFAVVIVLIYVMLVAWYGSFSVPLVVMLPIPMAIIGVIPAHVLLGMPVSAMAVIGVIALAGLMVRNSVLLVDFANDRVAAGAAPRAAIIEASQTRIRPILLAAFTVVLGDGVLFFDPLLKGLGVTMASGALFSTALTLLVIPLAYYQVYGRREERR